jgi:hypothetical protein
VPNCDIWLFYLAHAVLLPNEKLWPTSSWLIQNLMYVYLFSGVSSKFLFSFGNNVVVFVQRQLGASRGYGGDALPQQEQP